MILLFLMQLI